LQPGKQLSRELIALLLLFACVPIVGLLCLGFVDLPNPMLPVGARPFSRIVLVLTVVALVGVVLLFSSHARSRLLPLRALEDAVRRLTRGEYSHRLKLKPHDEFRSAFQLFNQMTSQLEASVRSSQSVADIDRLILSSADLETVLRKVLLTARLSVGEISLLLRRDMRSRSLSAFRLENQHLAEEIIDLVEITEDTLKDIEGYQRIARRVCGEDIRACLPVAAEGAINGVLVATAPGALETNEAKQLKDLADRLSVAFTNIRRSETLYQKAHFDDLTGLINRHAFEDRLREQISRSTRGEQGALLFIDLDSFKKVNDTEGHKAGDRLLIEIAGRLKTSLREVDTIARLGGDEFAVIVPGCESEKSVSALCERLIASMIRPVVVDRIEHTVGASIGVAVFPDDGRTVEELVMKADSAMYRAKEMGRSRFAFFDDTLNEANRHRVMVESRLRHAIKEQELHLHFQPKLRMADGTMFSAEALLRWTDSKLGEVSPQSFVPIAEETNLVHEFTSIQVDHVSALLAGARDQGVHLDHIAINVSTKQLMTDGFAISLLSLLDRRQLPHAAIEVEVTESVFAQDTAIAIQELGILRTAGIRVALDDFGTGFSSLNMLRELPLDVVKIDRSFITELETSDQARILVQHLISIATTLGKEVVAEGVETEVQLQHLREANCHYVQGFLIAKALPAAEFLRLARDWHPGEVVTLAN
jgi:diguanylate cyclase (GGDEF)-like protein